MRQLAKLFVLVAMLVAIPTLMIGQEVAAVAGVVTDVSGAVVPGVKVTLTNTRTNATSEAITNSVGAYTISKVAPGPGYKLTFARDGFEKVVVTDVYLGVGTTRTQNAELKVGKQSESVEVSAVSQDVTLNTSDASVGNSFSMIEVNQLPVQIRDNPAALLQLQPGVVNATGGSDGLGSRAGSVTGARGDQNNVTLDGLDVNDFATGQAFSAVANAPVDSIQEFRGETAGSLSASGRGSGGQIQMVTKSGTNQFHGSLSEYHRNTLFAANTYFNEVNNVKRAPLIRNQFAGTFGGPIIKDKLFFFFTYNGRRDAYGSSSSATVPLDSFRNGTIGYISNAAGCDSSAKRTNSLAYCIKDLTAAQAAALDPKGVGINSALMQFINSRYPHATSTSGGDGINTGTYRFNAPVHRTENDYVTKIDYNINSSQKLMGRFSILRDEYGDNVNYAAPMQFGGDPLSKTIQNKSYAYVVGHTWTISPTMINQFTYGETVSKLAFPTLFNPTGNYIWTLGGLTNPYVSPSSQARRNPIPIFKDDFTLVKGAHQIQIGGTFKPIKTWSQLVSDRTSVGIGLGGLTSALNSTLRPADLLSNTTARSLYDSLYTMALGRLASLSTRWNYDSSLSPVPQGTGSNRNYRYYETEAYLQDTWKVTPSLTLNYGVRYQYYSVPYETNGIEAAGNVNFDDYFWTRYANGMNGVSGNNTTPIITYDLTGKANGGGGLYRGDWTNFAPRVGFAYTPNFLKSVFGDKKSVIRGGVGMVYDHTVTNALNFIQDQNTYMFQTVANTQYGAASANTALLNDPRFTGLSAVPTPVAAPSVTRPYTPYYNAATGVANGTAGNKFNYAIDTNLKTPYSIVVNFGFQRELPGHFVMESTYVGRFGRRLIAQADASQLVDFRDPASGQLMSQAFANLTKQLQNCTANPNSPCNITSIPWFDNQVRHGAAAATGTAFAAGYAGDLIEIGDVADAVQRLNTYFNTYSGAYGLNYNVGMASQFAGDTFITNKGASNYHGLLTSLHKNLSYGLQFDLNYTFSHSIDNASGIANSIASNSGMGFICDAANLRTCRGNSDFDITHIINGNVIYSLPVGKGKSFGSNMPTWLDQIVGGWSIAGIPTWRTGIAFSTISDAYLMGYANNAPALWNGDKQAIRMKVHRLEDGSVNMYADPDAAWGSFSTPVGFQIGPRNNLRGPGYFNIDSSISKKFKLTEQWTLQFSGELYNTLNHPSFGLPGGGSNGAGADYQSGPGTFGRITSTSSGSRVAQFSLRLEF